MICNLGHYGRFIVLRKSEVKMQKISPLRSGLEAFKKFKIDRANKAEIKNNAAITNPFGITFKGTVLQMDVFESSKVQEKQSLKDKLAQAGKLSMSAWVSTINKFSSMKENVIAFTGRIKNDVKEFVNKINTTNIEFDFFKYNVSNLSKRPVSELGDMLKAEIGALGV